MTSRPSIVVLDDWEHSFRRLADWDSIHARANVTVHKARLHGAELLDAVRGASVIVLHRDRTPFDKALLNQLPNLEYIIHTGPRNKKLDRAALAERNIPVSYTEGGPARESTCEHTWALILASMRHLESQMAEVRGGGWRPEETTMALANVLYGERLGLIGLGEIGRRVAAVGKAFGMEIVAWSPNLTPARATQGGARLIPLEELLSTSRVVSLHLVPGNGTTLLINENRLALMRPDSLLVNTARPELVDLPALQQALKLGRPAQAALDVYDQEPLASDSSLRQMRNLVLTPHTGFVSEQVFSQFASGVVECLNAWLEKRPLPRVLLWSGSTH